MRAAQIDENNLVLQVFEVEDLGFLDGLVADPDAVAGAGDLYDVATGTFHKPAVEQVPGEMLEVMRRRLALTVDNTIASIYNRWTRFQPEYTAREQAAREYAATSYAGTPSIWIRSFAIPANLPPREAADMIIAQADALRQALEALGSQRMAKYGILGAPDAATAQQTFDSILAAVTAVEGSLP